MFSAPLAIAGVRTEGDAHRQIHAGSCWGVAKAVLLPLPPDQTWHGKPGPAFGLGRGSMGFLIRRRGGWKWSHETYWQRQCYNASDFDIKDCHGLFNMIIWKDLLHPWHYSVWISVEDTVITLTWILSGGVVGQTKVLDGYICVVTSCEGMLRTFSLCSGDCQAPGDVNTKHYLDVQRPVTALSFAQKAYSNRLGFAVKLIRSLLTRLLAKFPPAISGQNGHQLLTDTRQETCQSEHRIKPLWETVIMSEKSLISTQVSYSLKWSCSNNYPIFYLLRFVSHDDVSQKEWVLTKNLYSTTKITSSSSILNSSFILLFKFFDRGRAEVVVFNL